MGARGLAVLAVTGLVGIGLAIHGYGQGGLGGTAGLGPLASSRAPRPPSRATTTTPPASTTAAQKLGPLLSSTSYASYAFQVYPGPESGQARQATIGFKLHVTPHPRTFELSIAATGSGQGAQTSSFPAGDRVYFIEATLGDDAGDLDYNFGDDGVVVTDAQGHIVQ